MLFRCTLQHSVLSIFLTPVPALLQVALKAFLATQLYLMTFRVFNINRIYMAVVAIFFTRLETERVKKKETLLQSCTLYSQLVLTFSQKCSLYSLTVALLTFLRATFLHFPLVSIPRTILICHCTTNSGSSQIGLWTIMN